MMFGQLNRYLSLREIDMGIDKVSDRRGVDDFRYAKDTIIVDDRGYFDVKLHFNFLSHNECFFPNFCHVIFV